MSGILKRLRDRLLSGQIPESRPSPAAEEALADCMDGVVRPALAAARDRLAADGYEVVVEEEEAEKDAQNERPPRCALRVVNKDGDVVFYVVEGRLYHRSAFAFPILHGRQDRPRIARLHIETNGGSHEYNCRATSIEKLRDDCVRTCRKWLDW